MNFVTLFMNHIHNFLLASPLLPLSYHIHPITTDPFFTIKTNSFEQKFCLQLKMDIFSKTISLCLSSLYIQLKKNLNIMSAKKHNFNEGNLFNTIINTFIGKET